MSLAIIIDPDKEEDFHRAFYLLRDLYERKTGRKMNFYSHLDAERIRREEKGYSTIR